ncbi:unnamed protein product [Soboliphyme baturini]|uniref:Uncharacterized protein n=1 Tax=Soboliphyme baturini TaxID=241478 RepID=A0A183IZK4_9BILA|nr:unnamed protein product [Soboliphyme baturini]
MALSHISIFIVSDVFDPVKVDWSSLETDFTAKVGVLSTARQKFSVPKVLSSVPLYAPLLGSDIVDSIKAIVSSDKASTSNASSGDGDGTCCIDFNAFDFNRSRRRRIHDLISSDSSDSVLSARTDLKLRRILCHFSPEAPDMVWSGESDLVVNPKLRETARSSFMQCKTKMDKFLASVCQS